MDKEVIKRIILENDLYIRTVQVKKRDYELDHATHLFASGKHTYFFIYFVARKEHFSKVSPIKKPMLSPESV
ncbi:MAG: hypothetical protein WD577_05280 [Bacteroidales bacterium]